MQVMFLILLFVVGTCLGSFLCCQARRLHLYTTKKSTTSQLSARSICLSCKRQLKWYDNIPILSWLLLKGKCRNCGHKIGIAEILSEVGVGLALLAIGTTINIMNATPLDWATFIATLVFTLVLCFLAIYDGIYGELPGIFLTISIICAIIVLILKEWTLLSVSPFSYENIFAPLFSILILGGLYLALYLVSKGKWVGDGDWLLGLSIGIALIHPWYALIALFLSNFFACLVMLPIIKKFGYKKIHFGPFLVIAFIVTIACSDFFISVL